MSTKTKKKTILIATAICLLAIAALGTMAYFTSESEVVNTFTSGNVSITLDESKVTNVDNPKTGDPKWILDTHVRVKENNYTGVLPGDTVPKDPTVHNTGNTDTYLAVMVYLPKDAALAMYPKVNSADMALFLDDLEGLNDGRQATETNPTWTSEALGLQNNYYTYRLIYKGSGDGVLAAKANAAVFTGIKFGKYTDSTYAGQTMKLYIDAYACQTDGFTTDKTGFEKAKFALKEAFGTDVDMES